MKLEKLTALACARRAVRASASRAWARRGMELSADSLFNSGDLEACGPRGFVSISLNRKRDESQLKEAAVELAGRVTGS